MWESLGGEDSGGGDSPGDRGSPGGEEAAHPSDEPPPQNQDVKDLQDQFVQQQTMLSQLKEALSRDEESNTSNEKKFEAFASRLSDIKSRTSSVTSPRGLTKPLQVLESKKALPVGETATHSKSLSILRQKVNENRAIFEQRGREKSETKRGVEVMIEQLRAQLAAKDDTIRALQENLEASISTRQLIPATEPMEEEHVAVTAAKEQKIAELTNQVAELQAMVAGLQENLLEKDSVIDARTKAIALMSEDLCRKGKTTLDTLDETRDEMRQMQNTFASFESDMKNEKDLLLNHLREKDETIREAEERFEELKLESVHLTTLVTDLQAKLLEFEHRPAKMEQGHSDETSSALVEANKQIIKLKALTKKQTKQINSLKKGGDGTGESVDLHNRIAELEEEKGNLQLHLVDFDELKISELHLGECVSQLRSEIATLETQVKQQMEDLSIKEDLEIQVTQNLAEIKKLQDAIHEVSERKVQAEMKSVELEESMDNLLKDKNNLTEMYTSLQEENKTVIAQMQVDRQVASRVEVGMLSTSEKSEELISDLNNQLALKQERSDELTRLFSSALGSGSPEDWYRQIISIQQTLAELSNTKDDDESRILKLENMFHDLQKELAERNQELNTIKSEHIKKDDALSEIAKNLSAMETTIAQKDAELQRSASEFAQLKIQHKKVIANLRAKSKTYDENMNELKSVIAERDNCISDLTSQIDVMNDSQQMHEAERSVHRKLIDDTKQEAAHFEQQFKDTCALLLQEQANRNDLVAHSEQKLVGIQQDFEHLKSLHGQELKEAHATIAQLSENTGIYAAQLSVFSSNLHDKEELLKALDKDLCKAKELQEMCLFECNKKVTALCTLLKSRQIELCTYLKAIAQAHFTDTEQSLDVFTIGDPETDPENFEQVSENFDAELQKISHWVQLLGHLLENKTEAVRNATKQNADLVDELHKLNDSVENAEKKYNAAISNHQTEMQDANESIAKYDARIVELESELNAHTSNLDTSDSSAKIAELESIIDSQENSLVEYSQSIDENHQRIAELLNAKAHLEQQIEILTIENSNDKSELSVLVEAHMESEELVVKYLGIIKDCNTQIEHLEKQYATAEEDLANMRKRNQKMSGFEQELEASTSENNRLTNELHNVNKDLFSMSEAQAVSQVEHEEGFRQLKDELVSLGEQLRIAKSKLEINSEKNCELENNILEVEEALKRTRGETAVALEAKESEIADARLALQEELVSQKNLENQLESLKEASDEKISDLETKNDKLKTLITRIEGFKDLCKKDINDIISESEIRIGQMQTVEKPSAEAIIVPTMSSQQGTVSVDIGDSWHEQSDEGWGWGSEEAKLEEEHQAVSHQKIMEDGSSEHLRNQLSVFEAQVKELEGEKTQLASELRVAQVRSGKLVKKLKELRTSYEIMAKKSSDGTSSLDQTMESVFTHKISSLESQAEELKAEKAQTLKEKEMMKNQLSALEWQISELTDDKSNMSQMIYWSEQNINEKEKKIADLLFEVSKMANDMTEQKERFERTVNELQTKIGDSNSDEQLNLSSAATETKLEDMQKAYNELQTLFDENQLDIQGLSEVRNNYDLKCQEYENLTSLYQENIANLENLRQDQLELQLAYEQTKTDLKILQSAHNELSFEYQENQAKLAAVLEELAQWKSQVSHQEISTQHFSNTFQNQLAQLSEENLTYRDLLSVKESELNEICQQLSGLEVKCSESVEQQRLELENMKNILSAKEVHAVQYVQEISNLRASLSKQTTEIEHLKAELLRRIADIDFVSEQLTQSEHTIADLNDLNATKDQDVIKLKSRLDVKDSQLEGVTKELLEHQHIIQLLKSVRESEIESGANVKMQMSGQSDKDANEDDVVSLHDHNIALYSWHQQDMRVNEMSLELMQLIEERDTLQLRLSTSLRTIEELRKLNEGLASGTTILPVASSSSQSSPGGSSHSLGAQAITEGDEQLANKLDQVRSVGRQQRQMALQHHGGVAIDANYTVSRDAQSQSETLMNWIFGKSTPKVQHI